MKECRVCTICENTEKIDNKNMICSKTKKVLIKDNRVIEVNTCKFYKGVK